jgi:hypothetical protein
VQRSSRSTAAWTVAIALSITTGWAVPAEAELLAIERFDGRAGAVRQHGQPDSNGWVATWVGDGGLTIDGEGGLSGRGWAQRDLQSAIDFADDGEWFIRVTISRSGARAHSDPDFATLTLMNTDRDPEVNLRPLAMGINSAQKFQAGLVASTRQLFGDPQNDRAYTLIARLQTFADKPDVLTAWVFEPDQTLPQTLPEKPDAQATYAYGGKATRIRLQTGPGEHSRATFHEVRVGTSWQAMVDPEAQVASAKADFRPFPHLRVTDNALHTLPIQWAHVSLLPASSGQPPRVLVSSDHPWLAEPSMLYEPADAGIAADAVPAPNPKLPLYGTARVNELLPHGRYQAVPRTNGEGFDLYEIRRLEWVGTIDREGELSLSDSPRRIQLPGDDDRTKALENLRGTRGLWFLADVDGDGVVDLLIARMNHPPEQTSYWPRGQSPWVLESRQLVGPHRDVHTTEGFRGYDIAGNWLGQQRTKELVWARGSINDGRLAFAEPEPVYFGRDDYPVLWRDPSYRMAPAFIQRGDSRYVVLFSDVDQVLALPVLDVPDSTSLHVGKAQELLAPGQPRRDLILSTVLGILDVTGDGIDEIVVGSGSNGRAMVLAGERVSDFQVLGALQTIGGVVAVDTLAVPTLGDWNGDGINDLIIGDGTGYYTWWPGTEDPLVFQGQHELTTSDGEPLMFKGVRNLQGPNERGWSYSQPALFDWTGDGQPEIIANDNTATLRLIRRIDADEPTMVSYETFTHQGAKLGVSWRARMNALPGSHRLAGDDRPVLLFLDLDQVLSLGIPTATGSTEIERIVPLTYTDGTPIRTSGSAGMSGRSVLSAVDWDGDGNWDILLGAVALNIPAFYDGDPTEVRMNRALRSSSAFWFRNVGTNESPLFERARRIRWADGNITRVETHGFAAEAADLTGDGQFDLIFGDGPGFIFHLRRDQLSWDR